MRSQRATLINDYIKDNPDCQETDVFVSITRENGKVQQLPCYRLPCKLVYYNIENGRFQAEYNKLIEKLGKGDLDNAWTKKGEDKKERENDDINHIEELLISKTEDTDFIEDLKRRGQLKAGIIDFNGEVLNGNRRLCAIRSISKERAHSQDTKFKTILVGRCPEKLEPVERWLIECEEQFAKSFLQSYNPINERLKIESGKKLHKLTNEQIADRMHVSVNKVKKYLRELKIGRGYLEHISAGKDYNKLGGKSEHLIDYDNRIGNTKRHKELQSQDREEEKFLAFKMMDAGASHTDIRGLGDILQTSSFRKEFVEDNVRILDGKLKDGKITQKGYNENLMAAFSVIREQMKINANKPKPPLYILRQINDILDGVEKAGQEFADGDDKVQAEIDILLNKIASKFGKLARLDI